MLKRCGREQLSDGKNAKISQLIAMVYGFVCVGLALLADGLSGMLQLVLTIFGVVGGPLFGLFTLGMFFWIANEQVRVFL
jgi:sodium-coupled monocarboxylate transporter 8/12